MPKSQDIRRRMIEKDKYCRKAAKKIASYLADEIKEQLEEHLDRFLPSRRDTPFFSYDPKKKTLSVESVADDWDFTDWSSEVNRLQFVDAIDDLRSCYGDTVDYSPLVKMLRDAAHVLETGEIGIYLCRTKAGRRMFCERWGWGELENYCKVGIFMMIQRTGEFAKLQSEFRQ